MAMIELIEQHRAELAELCRNFRVATLELFGSAADGSFDPAQSDLDFLVQFEPLTPVQHADCYFSLLFGLEDLFQRKIDLVETSAIDNPYFLKSIDQSRRVLYAA